MFLIRETNNRNGNITAHVVNLNTGRLRCGARPTGPDNMLYVAEQPWNLGNRECRSCVWLCQVDAGTFYAAGDVRNRKQVTHPPV